MNAKKIAKLMVSKRNEERCLVCGYFNESLMNLEGGSYYRCKCGDCPALKYTEKERSDILSHIIGEIK